MTREVINELKKYTLGKKNTEKVEISVLQLNRVIKALEQNPKTGRWIKSSIGGAKICSICQAHMGLSSFKYCPNCGARMVESQESKECNTCKHQLTFMCSEWKECKDKSKYEPQEREGSDADSD